MPREYMNKTREKTRRSDTSLKYPVLPIGHAAGKFQVNLGENQ